MGAIIGNGYIVPADLGEFGQTMYVRILKAADDGDKTARAILDTMPISTYEDLYVRNKYGIGLYASKKGQSFILRHAHYPPSFKGKCWPELQRQAELGSYTARRLINKISRARFLDPDFQLQDI